MHLPVSSRLIGRRLAGLIAAALAASAAPAWAHGDIQSASPEEGARVRRPPREVALVLAEPAASGSSLVVVDGCKEEVSGEPVADGERYSVAIEGGRPGRWSVRLRSISSVDGHLVRAGYSFTLAGKKDCSSEPTPEPDETDDANTSSRPPIANPDDDGTSFPVVPFALGTVALIGLAVALRRPKA
ncbi:MAG TPA: copper resistance CopC family protein [Actinomycetota bacterium]|nr:copper resistance CopC family protein [Actinomycetota bacterium]